MHELLEDEHSLPDVVLVPPPHVGRLVVASLPRHECVPAAHADRTEESKQQQQIFENYYYILYVYHHNVFILDIRLTELYV